MNAILEQLALIKIIPVVVIDDAEHAVPLAKALLDGGLPTMEITFRTSAAKAAIKNVSQSYPNMLVGAGTVLTFAQAKEAIECGARYIVAPGLNRNVVEYCMSNKMTVIPGVLTPTEIESALELGVSVMKLFPAEAIGGTEYIKAVSAPYKNVRFIPTGGINEANIASYLALPQVLACGGSWMVKADLIAKKQFAEIQRLTTLAKQKITG